MSSLTFAVWSILFVLYFSSQTYGELAPKVGSKAVKHKQKKAKKKKTQIILTDHSVPKHEKDTITLTPNEHASLQKRVSEFYKNWKLTSTIGEGEYEYIFEWNCFCSTCLELPKYISVKDQKIETIKFSDNLGYDYYDDPSEDSKILDLKIPNFGCDNLYLHSKHYHNIEGLFHILQQSLHPSYYDPNRHIISITFDKEYYYPKTVYISNDLHELGWNIKCLSFMGNGKDNSIANGKCSNLKGYPFWIEKKWQEIIGWAMILLVLCWSCIGYFIAYLKKRARKKHREHIRNQMTNKNSKNGSSVFVGNRNPSQRLRNRKNSKAKKKKNRQQIVEESDDGTPVPSQAY